MTPSRRSFLHAVLALLLACLPSRVWAKPAAKPNAKALKLEEAIAQETGWKKLGESERITLKTPDIAEDGAVVPITVESGLPDVEAILIFVEKNPSPLAARFRFDQSMDAFVSLRIKMNETCDVIAVVKSGGEFFSARKKVNVVVGGCG